MDAKIRLWLLVALMSISAYPYTDCCSCIHYHAQMAFCDSDVVRARFLGATVTDKYSEFTGKYSVITYEIETLQVLKGGDTIKNLSFIYTSTAYYCGYHIGQQDYNKDYLITGPMRNGRVEVIRCSYIVAWSTLTEAQIEGVERAYSCHCRICFQWDCYGESRNYCILDGTNPWDIHPDAEEIGTELYDQMCEHNVNGECTWQPVYA